MKFVRALDPDTARELRRLHQESSSRRVRWRAHAVLLSAKGYSIDQIADIYETDRDAVSRSLDRWLERGFAGLEDEPRSGRPAKIPPDQHDQIVAIALEEPRQLKRGLALITEQFGITLSLESLRRLLRAQHYRYKRIRTSLRQKRNRAAFEQAQRDLRDLERQEEAGQIALYYFDQCGFALRPVVPYAWQPVGQRLEVQHTGGKALNVLGLLKRDMTFVPYVTETRVTTETVVACLDHFASTISKKTVVVIDNAPMHRSGAFQARMAQWEAMGLSFYFLPSYSPELNLIELLWKQIKYYWMPLSAYLSWEALGQALEEILVGIGSKYRITFA